jgi:hypothetical protein
MVVEADGRYELVKETNMVDYVESLFNAAKEAGAQVEGIGKSSRTFDSRVHELTRRLPSTKRQGNDSISDITGEGSTSDEGHRGPRGSREAQEQWRQGEEFGNLTLRIQRMWIYGHDAQPRD